MLGYRQKKSSFFVRKTFIKRIFLFLKIFLKESICKKRIDEKWIGLNYLFNGISAFMVYLMPIPSLLKNSSTKIKLIG